MKIEQKKLEIHLIGSREDVPVEIVAAYDYWREKSGETWAPAWRDFELYELAPHLVPWVAVVDIKDSSGEYVYRFFGSARVMLHGEDFTGRSFAEIGRIAEFGQDIATEYDTVVSDKEPKLCRKHHSSTTGGWLEFESIRLPLSDTGDRVDQVVSVFNHSYLTQHHYEIFGTKQA